MGAVASQITSLTIVCSTVYSDADQRKYQSFVSLAFVRGLHWGPVNSPHIWPVTRKTFPFNDVMLCCWTSTVSNRFPLTMCVSKINLRRIKCSIMFITNFVVIIIARGWTITLKLNTANYNSIAISQLIAQRNITQMGKVSTYLM